MVKDSLLIAASKNNTMGIMYALFKTKGLLT